MDALYRTTPGEQAPDVLICAGLDPSGGAGLIADTRVVSMLGARPCGVVTALTVQTTTGVVSSHAVDPETVRDQLELLLADVEVRAIKLGMIGSTAIAQAIGAALELTGAPLVWDPVMYPSRGDVPLGDSLLGGAVKALQRHVALLTPNARELAYLAGREVTDLDSAVEAAYALSIHLGAAVLVKGGHLAGAEAIDVLVRPDRRDELRGPRLPQGEDVHGTGCALASAIAAHLARGAELLEACTQAKQFVSERIARAVRPGRGAPAIV
jgi:hydroxymethylpyrimidine kinase/phosphomethylpyrimidine kinase/thiamine-phosphate diphosphorylase